MTPLSKGVTGFDAPDVGVPVKLFTAACHAAARQVMGQVKQVRRAYDQVTSNFHLAAIAWQDQPGTVQVLCNAHYPIVAFSNSPKFDGDWQIEFIDCPAIAEALRAEFSIVTKQDACAGIDDELVSRLSETELHQIHYWQPRRVGDVIFNHWD